MFCEVISHHSLHSYLTTCNVDSYTIVIIIFTAKYTYCMIEKKSILKKGIWIERKKYADKLEIKKCVKS